jgi:multidrug efflux pump subunit AcrB
MNFRNISAWSIRNPVPAIVLFMALTIAGLVSFMRMDVNQNPEITFPGVAIIVSQPGAAPSELETQITQRVEASVRSLEGVDEIRSTVSEGVSQTFVSFTLDTPVDRAVTDVRDAVSQIRGQLPDGILEPQIIRAKVNGGSFGLFSVEANDMTLEQLSWFVKNNVSRRLLAIEGMQGVDVYGAVDREIRVILDPARLQAHGLTAAQVNQQLRAINTNSAGGRAEIAGAEQAVRVLGNAESAYELGQTDISIGNGQTVKLADIADVKDSYAERRSLAKMDNRPVVSFGVQRSRGASEVTLYNETLKVLDKIEKENPNVHFVKRFTTVKYTLEQYKAAMRAMIEGAVLAVLVVFLFLRDYRATVVSALAIPLSAIPTFWVMSLLGFNLNFMTLLALSLVAGVLVDDAIVEIENIVRHMRMGKTAYQAAIDAADEIGLAVVGTTFSIVAVFLPVGLMPGIAGQFFKNFGFTVVSAVLISLLVARLITPMVAAYFLKAHGHASHGEGWLMDKYMAILRWSLDARRARAERAALNPAPLRVGYWFTEAVFVLFVLAGLGIGTAVLLKVLPMLHLWSWLSMLLAVLLGLAVAYGVAVGLGFVIRAFGGGVARYHDFIVGRWKARRHDHRLWIIGIGMLSLVATVIAFATLAFTFFPVEDSDSSRAMIEMPPGATLQQTELAADRAASILRSQQEVQNAIEYVDVGSATISMMLRPDRKRSSSDFEREVGPLLNQIPDARVTFANQNGGESNRDVSIMLAGDDPAKLESAALKLVDQMGTLPNLRAPRIEGELPRPEIVIKPRLDLAADLGVTTAALSQTIRIATLGEIDQNAAKFSLSDRQIPIRVALSEQSRENLSTIQNLPVPTTRGTTVPLKVVADISFGAGPSQIERYNQERRVVVGADLAPGAISGEERAKAMQLPIMKHLPEGVHFAASGEAKWQQEMMVNFVIAVLAGVMLVFAVLVLLYRRALPPLVNMGSLVLAPLGSALALHVAGMPVSLPVFIGLLMLLGIVAKNSILLIDFAIEEMGKGVEKFEAIMDAGHKRAQPIVMTTVAMIAGMTPTALSIGSDGSWNQPMAVSVIGGLTLSTLLTLLIVPAGFSLADGFERRLAPLIGRVLTTQPGDRESRPAPGTGHAVPAE